MTKDILQQLTVEASEQYPNLLLEWATGTGKSLAAIKIQDRHKPVSTLLTVAQIPHIDNWKKEYQKADLISLLETTEIFCHASLKKYKGRRVNLLIIDEAHHMSEQRVEILRTIKADKVILLTATMDIEVYNNLENVFGKFYKSYVPLETAIEKKMLPTPHIYVMDMYLDDNLENEELIIEWGKSHQRQTLHCRLDEKWKYMRDKATYPNMKLIINCTQQQKYDYLSEQFEYYKGLYMIQREPYMKIKWMRAGLERKQMLGELKLDMAKKIIKKLSKKRYICFCSSIKQAELLGDGHTIHSKNKDSLKILEQFNNNMINKIYAVNMLQEGQNLAALDVGVIIQLDGQERSFIQRFGRTLRAHNPVQIILAYKNTRDEDYLNNALEGINMGYVQRVSDVKDIKL